MRLRLEYDRFCPERRAKGMRMLKWIFLSGILCVWPCRAGAAGQASDEDGKQLLPGEDSVVITRKFVHRLGMDLSPAYIISTHSFMEGDNASKLLLRNAYSAHLKYSFRFASGTVADRLYGGAYQGVGVAAYTFLIPSELGNPVAFYIFQGARIARLAPWLSLNYEWNLGLSFGWKPYDYFENEYNKVIGARVNAYINVDFYFNWALSRQVNLTTGVGLTHFSNGNTKLPNSGLNTIGLKAGLVYDLTKSGEPAPEQVREPAPEFRRHMSYDLTFFGSWRRKGFMVNDDPMISPDTYKVLGFSFAAMYNFGYKFRAGVAADGVYDQSANVFVDDFISGTVPEFSKPPLSKQLALGVSGRIEYVMPYFTVGFGIGTNVVHAGGDLRSVYQMLYLKAEVTRSSYIHIGYNLHNFSTPNFLMLGIGFRFNNKRPAPYR